MAWPVGIPKNMTPAERVERARHAARSRTTVEHHLKALAGVTLTEEQRAQLTALLHDTKADA